MVSNKGELDELFGSDDDQSTEAEKVENRPEEEEKNAEDEEGAGDENIFAGVSDDEEEVQETTTKEEEEDEEDNIVPRSKGKQREVNEMFGESDEDEMEVVEEKEESFSSPTKSSQLDQILGINEQETSPRGAAKIPKVEMQISTAERLAPHQRSIFLRTPNFVKIQPRSFDAAEYNADEEKQEFNAATTIMRHTAERGQWGSNARLVKWSDNTYNLIVGSSVFQVKLQGVDNCFTYEDEEVVVKKEAEEEGEEKVCFECIGEVPQRMTIMPLSLKSDTHTRMSVQISEKFRKEKRVSVLDYDKMQVNPEKALHLMAKQEEELQRKARKLRQQQEEIYGSRGRSYMKRPSMTEGYLNDDEEGEEEEEGEGEEGRYSLSKLKKDAARKVQRQHRRDEEEDEEEDEEDEEDDGFIVNDEEEEGEGESLGSQDTEGDEEDEEEEAEDEDDDEEEEVEGVDDEGEGEDEAEEGEKEVKKKKKDKKKGGKEKEKQKAKKEKQKKRARPTLDSDNEEGAAEAEEREEEEEGVVLQQKKKVRRAFVDSDEEM